jgi:hypothetical protein
VGEGQKLTRCIDSPARRRGGVKRGENGVILHWKKHPSCTQNRAVPTRHRTPDAPRWRSRLALDVGEGQKQTRCIDSPVRRRGGVKRGENGVILHWENTRPAHRTGLFRPTTALPTPPVGVPASPWTWAKARSQLGELIRLCGDGAVSNEAKWGHFTRGKHPSCTQNRAVPTHHRTPDAPRWRSRLALDSPVRRRGGVERGENGVILHGKKHLSCTQNRAVPTHHRTPDAPRWRSRLALDVGEDPEAN